LEADHPDFDINRRGAEWGLEWHRPLGVVLDARDRVLGLNHTYEVSLHSLADDPEDSNRLIVCFWGFCSVCYLTRDHPDFERIRKTLEEARTSNGRLIFANETWPVEGETESWLKILDVRPLPVPDSSEAGDGTAGSSARGTVSQAVAAAER
jgi:hypothetical protein